MFFFSMDDQMNIFKTVFVYSSFWLMNIIFFTCFITPFAIILFSFPHLFSTSTIDIILGVYMLAAVGLNHFIVVHQINSDIGYFKGWKMGFLSMKMYLGIYPKT